jgi:hypothetical protein
VSTPDPLAEFFAANPRHSSNLTGRTGVHGQVDQILNDLHVPATVDADGDWRVVTDVGPFILLVDKQSHDVVVIQTIRNMEKRIKNYADDMHVLLAMNLDARGAWFAAVKDGESDLLVLTSRISSPEISSERVQQMLHDSFRLSRRIDELLGNAPPQPAAQPAPPAGAPAAPADWQAADAALAQAEQEHAAPPPLESLPPPTAEQPPGAEQPPAAEPPPDPGATRISEQPAPEPPPPAPEPAPPAAEPPPPAPEALPPADWYADPYGQARLRYWDGQAWTQHTAQ